MAFIRRHRRAASLLEVIGIYDQHARSMEAPGTYPHAELIGHTSAPDGVLRYFIRETSNEFGDTERNFNTQLGLFRFRNRRIILREDFRLSETEREEQIANLYENLRQLT